MYYGSEGLELVTLGLKTDSLLRVKYVVSARRLPKSDEPGGAPVDGALRLQKQMQMHCRAPRTASCWLAPTGTGRAPRTPR
jgi:hypothetical protein